jgi:hypothetical protein
VAGAPRQAVAPIVARLAKANVSIATTLLVVLTVATIIALPLGLPLGYVRLHWGLHGWIWPAAHYEGGMSVLLAGHR